MSPKDPQVIEDFAPSEDYFLPSSEGEKVVMVGVRTPKLTRAQVKEHLDELEELVRTAGGKVVQRVVQEMDKVNAATLVGKGKVGEIAELIRQHEASLVVFDEELTGSQIRNLEKQFPCKVIDRPALILDIFANRAQTREAKTQVELAQLRYLLPRLTKIWTHLSRQAGGIGARGVGEKQLEIDRRIIKRKISKLEKELEKISKRRKERSKSRSREFTVALVGYTNTGKSTLLNALSGAGVLAEEKLFATLDSTVRRVNLDSHRVILVMDTVGFIRKLPHHLVASFRSTLEAVEEADLVLHLADGSHPDVAEHVLVVRDVLQDLEVDDRPRLLVFNKSDRTNPEERDELQKAHPDALFISATTKAGFKNLLESIKKAAGSLDQVVTMSFEYKFMPRYDRVKPELQVLAEEFLETGVTVTIRGRKESLETLARDAQARIHEA